MPRMCPSFAMRSMIFSRPLICRPVTKKVAFTFSSARISSTFGVTESVGPSSKVRNISLDGSSAAQREIAEEGRAAESADECREICEKCRGANKRRHSRTVEIFFMQTVCTVLRVLSPKDAFENFLIFLQKILDNRKKGDILKKTDEVEE